MAEEEFIQTPKGMHDLTPEDCAYFYRIENACRRLAKDYRFDRIDFPILENALLFKKGTGANTDIVEKQMYTLRTKSGEVLALRPEGTPSVVRFYLEHGARTWPQPVKLWYWGPFFRYEKAQAGRYRQFHQFGFEIIGGGDAALDAQVINLFYRLLAELKIKNLVVEINSIGRPGERETYQKVLVKQLKKSESELCVDCRRRLARNPLRILDCKEPACQEIVGQLPHVVDYLSDECRQHFQEVLELLGELNIPYRLNPHLVRGLDYYTRTVFEIVQSDDEEKKALVGGGRYDGLVELLGAPPAPAVGAAAGIERIVSAMKSSGHRVVYREKPEVFIAQLGPAAKKEAIKLFEELRQRGVKVAEAFGRNSLNAQLKRADRLGVKYTVIIGQKEALDGTITLKTMSTGQQRFVKRSQAVSLIKKRL